MTQISLNWSVPSVDRVRLRGQNLAIYERLKRGTATNVELAAISLKYTSRVDDLRKSGIDVRATRESGGVWSYRLETK